MMDVDRISIRRGTEEDLDILMALSVQRDKEQHYGTERKDLRIRMTEMMRSDLVGLLLRSTAQLSDTPW